MKCRLCQGILLPRLAVLMDCALVEGFSRGVDTIGQAMRHHPLLFSLGGWPPTREVDPSPAWRPTGLPPGSVIVCPSSQCLSHLYQTTLLWRIPTRFLDDQPSTRDSASPISRRHNVSARGNL